ncbi:acylphosphatase [Candidatus Thiodiazotropha endoloripes]|uniref:Acylphosphatase-like domain-containing protein n=1 Tax=Candidatus Thiodiazotropha endoloripes TaxID=1818881 RepID=A0A1E2UTP4_9GAMM|nr:acylphosphatase [Candidatus Thiodiazotropha endoloripes]ODB82380.1 hypothetical protein A3194_19180 [Candidatus Thiodiazotropha endoloripes]ODB98133.1 hypothetical protein A3196_16025 [Candidatus Thiodiazotropha endoloripes]
MAIESAERIRVQGLVQGVGFRPKVWHLARECGLRGSMISSESQPITCRGMHRLRSQSVSG